MEDNDENTIKEEKKEEIVDENNMDLNTDLKKSIWKIKSKNDGNNLSTQANSEEKKDAEIKNITGEKEKEMEKDEEDEEKGSEIVEKLFEEKEDINSLKEEPMGLEDDSDNKKIELSQQNEENNNNNSSCDNEEVNNSEKNLNEINSQENNNSNKDETEIKFLESGIIHYEPKEAQENHIINLQDLSDNDSSIEEFDNLKENSLKEDNNYTEEDQYF